MSINILIFSSLLNEICIIFKCKYIENEIKFNYLISTNFIILENIILFLFNIINLYKNEYIYFLFAILSNKLYLCPLWKDFSLIFLQLKIMNPT